MNINLIGHDYRYEVTDIILAFFPLEGDVSLTSEIKGRGGKIICKTEVTAKGRTAMGEADIPAPADDREIKDLVKRSAFYAAREISSVKIPWGLLTGIRPPKTAGSLIKSGQDPYSALTGYYMVSPEKARLAVRVAEKTEEIMGGADEDGVSLYVGIPFCTTRCLYCSFVSYATDFSGRFMAPYIGALKKELSAISELIRNAGRRPETLYIGGGTPTALPAPLLDELLSSLTSLFDIEGAKEFCVEAGRPDTLDGEKLKIMKGYGVNRLCINPQSMNDDTLCRIGRAHTAADTARAFEIARKMGFDNINTDIIAGLPGETVGHFENTLQKIAGLSPESLTVHTLYLKRASRLMKEINEHDVPTANTVEEMLALAGRAAEGMGMEPYYLYKQKKTLGNLENIGYALPGHESRYNVYIMEERQTILAAGAGAVTKLVRGDNISRIFNVKNPDDYINRIDEMIMRKSDII